MQERILVSACLLGVPVRYDGRSKPVADARLERWRAEGRLVAICPETAAGLPTPRPAAEIAPGDDASEVLAGFGRVVDTGDSDVSEAFVAGARAALEFALENGCRFALLTDGSPSCGSTRIRSGRFDGASRSGAGVTAALLAAHGIEVFAHDDIDALARRVCAVDAAACGNTGEAEKR